MRTFCLTLALGATTAFQVGAPATTIQRAAAVTPVMQFGRGPPVKEEKKGACAFFITGSSPSIQTHPLAFLAAAVRRNSLHLFLPYADHCISCSLCRVRRLLALRRKEGGREG